MDTCIPIRFPNISALSTHLQNKHKVKIVMESHSFDDLEAFTSWMTKEEIRTNSYYVNTQLLNLMVKIDTGIYIATDLEAAGFEAKDTEY